jgi:hypothetical protein
MHGRDFAESRVSATRGPCHVWQNHLVEAAPECPQPGCTTSREPAGSVCFCICQSCVLSTWTTSAGPAWPDIILCALCIALGLAGASESPFCTVPRVSVCSTHCRCFQTHSTMFSSLDPRLDILPPKAVASCSSCLSLLSMSCMPHDWQPRLQPARDRLTCRTHHVGRPGSCWTAQCMVPRPTASRVCFWVSQFG